jgi:predicted transcriptional regulator
MGLDKYDDFLHALARGERVSRHQHNVPSETMRELERMDIITRDEDGFHVAGPLFHLRNGF